jgi:two-component system phosphate regulon sensor histidine kinase PhoR
MRPSGEPQRVIAVRIAPRLLLGAFLLSVPAFLVLLVLGALGILASVAAVAAAAFIYVGVAVLLYPLISGIAAVQAAVQAMAADAAVTPEVETLAPTVRELWLVLGRWARAMQAKLKTGEAELGTSRAVLAALPEPLILVDEGRRIVRANAAAAELLGGRLLDRDLAGALRHPAVLAAADAVLRGEGGRAVDFEITSPVERHLRARVAPLAPHTAEGAAAVVVLQDLTSMKRSERLRADFVANASHELRTPLATLVGFIETLRGPAHDDAAARDRFLAIMAEQAARMRRLVDDLLSLSRIEMNEHRPPTEPIDVTTLLRGVADTLEQRAAARSMRVALDLPEDLPPIVGDSDELAQVFQNLIDNAIKYADPGTTVEVTARAAPRILPGARPGERSTVAIAVHDHGHGIAREHLPRLTERFYRVDAARSRELGGTGLGLAIVKHIVSHHRGALDIDSTLGEGSTFTVHLPAAPLHTGDPSLS